MMKYNKHETKKKKHNQNNNKTNGLLYILRSNSYFQSRAVLPVCNLKLMAHKSLTKMWHLISANNI